MHFTRSLAVLASVALVNAVPLPQDDGSGAAAPTAAPSASSAPSTNSTSNAIKLVSESDFCLFLPPQPGLDVATNEDNGIPFCSNGSNDVPGARPFPNGFITVAHYQQNDTYQQVTGYMNPSTYQLSPTDQGGQYDNHGSGKPIGASCQGYSYFVSVIEPADSRFCIRCCQNFEDCNSGRSGFGCPRVIPGDYSQADGSQPSGNDASAPQPSASAAPTGPSSGDGTTDTTDTTNTNAVAHANTDFNSVLDELPNDSSSGDSITDPSTGSASSDPSSGGSATDPSSGDSTADSSSSGSSTDSTGSSSNPVTSEFPTEITSLQALLSNGTSVQEIQQSFQQFIQGLQSKYPDATQPLQQLTDLTAKFNTTDEWNTFVQNLQAKISGAGGANTSNLPSGLPGASGSEPTGTVSDISLPTDIPSSASSSAPSAVPSTGDEVHDNVWVAENDASGDVPDPNASGAGSNTAPAAPTGSGVDDAASTSIPTGSTSWNSDAPAPSTAPTGNSSAGSSQPLTADELDKELDSRLSSFEQKLMDELRGLIGNKNSDNPTDHSNQASW